MKKRGVREFALMAVFTAFVTVFTRIVQIPVPGTTEYVNLGDGMVLLCPIFLGPVGGFLAAGLGSALGDIFSPYIIWAPWTLMIKGAEALIVYAFTRGQDLRSGRISARFVLGLILAASWMIAGYFVASTVMLGLKTALAGVVFNVLQGCLGIILALVLLPVFGRVISSRS
jgi:uncharacterized membrane protein